VSRKKRGTIERKYFVRRLWRLSSTNLKLRVSKKNGPKYTKIRKIIDKKTLKEAYIEVDTRRTEQWFDVGRVQQRKCGQSQPPASL
jgi:hypothetical protein